MSVVHVRRHGALPSTYWYRRLLCDLCSASVKEFIPEILQYGSFILLEIYSNPMCIGTDSAILDLNKQVELVCRVVVMLLRIHHQQLTATMSARSVLTSLHAVLHSGVQVYFYLFSLFLNIL